jgi:ketosteroid isomerase-like protein
MTLATDDILAIQKLIADYNHIVDAGDGEAFAALFVEDGSLDTGFNVVKGGDELRDFAAFVPNLAPGARHMVTNVSIDGDGTEATARLYLQMWSTAGGAAESKLVISGRYEDTLRRDGGGWRFVTRKMIPDA